MKNRQLPGMMIFAALFFYGCSKDQTNIDPSDLVPKTVEFDSQLPQVKVNGTQLHVEAFGNPAGHLLIFLHGGPGGDYRNAMSVRQLANDGYYVIFYDQRGSGLSKRHDKSSYSLQLVLDDLTAVIQHYRTTDTQKVFLFGHSWGAMLAAAYINAYPSRINGAVFAEAGGFNKALLDEYAANSRKLALFSETTNDVLYYDQFLTGKENDHDLLDYKSAIATSFSYAKGNSEGIEGPSPFWRNGAVVLNAFVDIAEKDGFDFTTNLHNYPTKTLFLYGENNKAYGLSFAQKEAAFFPNSQVEAIAGTGHEMIYFKWELLYPIVLKYLQSL